MKLCYQCFMKSTNKRDIWDLIPCDITTQRKCEECGLEGIYVREIDLLKIKKEE